MNPSHLQLKQYGTRLLILLTILTFPLFLHAQSNFEVTYSDDGKFGLQMKKNKEIKRLTKAQFDELIITKRLWDEPISVLYRQKTKWGIIEVESEKALKVTKPEFDKIHMLNGFKVYTPNLKGDFYIVWKEGKQALLSYYRYKDEANKIGLYYDEIGIDALKFEKDYQRVFWVKNGNKYGAENLMGVKILPVDYGSYEKFDSQSTPIIHAFKKNGKYSLVIDKNNFWDTKVIEADNVWVNDYTFLSIGSDTSVFYGNNLMKVADYKSLRAKHDKQRKDYEEESNKKELERLAKIRRKEEVLSKSFQKKERMLLAEQKSVYVLVDSFGVKVFDEGTGDFYLNEERLVQYLNHGTKLFVKSDLNKWYQYPYGGPYEDVTFLGGSFAVRQTETKWMVTGASQYYFLELNKGARITEAWEVNYVINCVFELNGKYGFISYNRNGIMKYLVAGFDHISIINAYQNNPRLRMELRGEVFNAYHDNISNNNSVKADVYGVPCGDSKCNNGIIGYSKEIIKGYTNTEIIRNTVVWEKGHYVPATITKTTVVSDQVRVEPKYCNNTIHTIKMVGLYWVSEKNMYEVEKY